MTQGSGPAGKPGVWGGGQAYSVEYTMTLFLKKEVSPVINLKNDLISEQNFKWFLT
jgi:hypothetical protein